MRLSNLQVAIIIALAATAGGRLAAQGDAPGAKLWQEIDQLAPRKAGLVPAPMPSAAIDWSDRISKGEEIMVRSADTPAEPLAMFYLGSFYFEAGRLDEAKAMFETIKTKFPTHQLVTFVMNKDSKDPKDTKSMVAQAIEDCATEMTWRTRHPRPPIQAPVLDPKVTATIHFTTGDVKVRFYRNVAPKHFENFVKHAKAGDYDGTKVGQIIQDALVSVGDPGSKLPVDPAQPRPPQTPGIPPVAHEFATLSHLRGMLSMSRNMTGNESHGMQFQFVLKDQPYFDFTQTIFGKVVEGLEVVDAISKQQRAGNAPATDVSIKGISIEGQ